MAAWAHRCGDTVAVWAHNMFNVTMTHIFIEIQTKPRNMNTSSGCVDEDSCPAVSDWRRTERMREVLLRSKFNGARDLSELRFLLTHGARSVNVPFKDKSWETTYAILEVVTQKYWDGDWVFQKIRLLCCFGADVSNANGITPLYLVMYRNWCNTPPKQHVLEIKVGRLLLHYGATRAPTIACILCRTVRLKTVEHIRILLDAGVDVDEIERETGQNALVIAKELRLWDAVHLLQMRSARRGRKMVLPF